MATYIKSNITGLVLILVAVATIAAMGALKGCSIDEMIPVSVPQGVQKSTGSQPRVSLAEAPSVLSKHTAIMQTDGQLLAENIERAAWFSGLAKSFVAPTVEAGQFSVQGLPGGSILAALIGGFGGLLIEKPGTKKKTRETVEKSVKDAVQNEARVWREKIESYNKAKQVEAR